MLIALRVAAVVLIAIGLFVLCFWLNVPRSIPLMVQGAGLQRQPAEFDIEWTGLGREVSHVPLELYYFPLTPVYGITSHYVSIISPLQIDTIHRTIDVPVRDGRARFSAPLGLLGLSNYRLQGLQLGADEAPYRLKAAAPQDPSQAPKDLDIPSIVVRDGEYRFDGALALWRLAASGDANPYVYSSRVGDVDAPILWDGLRTLRARIDLAPYPVSSFVAGAGWDGAGWKNLGYELTRPHATLTDTKLTLERNLSVPLPFSRECESPPQFTVVSDARTPGWSRIAGLWRPVSRNDWEALLRAGRTADLTVRFVPAASGRASLERREFFDVLGRTSGTYRLFAACPNPRYDSVAVTWIDIAVANAPNGG